MEVGLQVKLVVMRLQEQSTLVVEEEVVPLQVVVVLHPQIKVELVVAEL